MNMKKKNEKKDGTAITICSGPYTPALLHSITSSLHAGSIPESLYTSGSRGGIVCTRHRIIACCLGFKRVVPMKSVLRAGDGNGGYSI